VELPQQLQQQQQGKPKQQQRKLPVKQLLEQKDRQIQKLQQQLSDAHEQLTEAHEQIRQLQYELNRQRGTMVPAPSPSTSGSINDLLWANPTAQQQVPQGVRDALDLHSSITDIGTVRVDLIYSTKFGLIFTHDLAQS
jgi:exonuclease VII large subunit